MIYQKIQNLETSSFSVGENLEFLRHSDRRLTSMDFPQFCPLFYGNNVVIVFPHLWRDKSLYLVTAAAAWLLYYCGLKAHCHPSMKIMDDSRPLCIHNDGVHMVDNNSKKNREKDNAHSWLLILLVEDHFMNHNIVPSSMRDFSNKLSFESRK